MLFHVYTKNYFGIGIKFYPRIDYKVIQSKIKQQQQFIQL